jgi:peroxiredoxin
MTALQNNQVFPHLEIPAVGGGMINLPHDLEGSYSVVLIYRGNWCPFCNDQMAAFVNASEELEKEGIKVVAFSVDNEAATKEFIAKHHIPFKVGHSANPETVAAATGAYTNVNAVGPFLETTGFVLGPNGAVITAVYSSLAIGRLVPSDVIRLVSFLKSKK